MHKKSIPGSRSYHYFSPLFTVSLLRKIPCCYLALLNPPLPFSFLLNMQLGSNLLSNQHKRIAHEEKKRKGYLTNKLGQEPAERPKGT